MTSFSKYVWGYCKKREWIRGNGNGQNAGLSARTFPGFYPPIIKRSCQGDSQSKELLFAFIAINLVTASTEDEANLSIWPITLADY